MVDTFSIFLLKLEIYDEEKFQNISVLTATV